MKNNSFISPKNKYKILWVGIVLFIPVVYYWGIKNTVEIKAARDRALDNVALSNNAPQRINSLKKQLGRYDQKMNQYLVDTISGGEPLLHMVSEYCVRNQVELHKVDTEQWMEKGEYKLETLPLTLRGGFKSMVGLLYHLEQVEKKGRIASVSFAKVNDHKIRKEALELKIFLQTLYAK